MKTFSSPGHRNVHCESIKTAAWEFARRKADANHGCGRGAAKLPEYLGNNVWRSFVSVPRGKERVETFEVLERKKKK